MGAKVLVESTVFEGVRSPVTARDSGQKGSAVLNDVSLGGGADDAPAEGGLQPEAVPYEYGVLGSGNVKDIVLAGAGQRMVFEI
jgi:pectate lyase